MSTHSPAADKAREKHRQVSGEFGVQPHSAPEAQLGGTPVLQATGEPVTVAFFPCSDGYEGFSLAAARAKLHIPATEPDGVVLGVIDLMGEQGDYPPYVTQEPGYEAAGNDARISTADWYNPLARIQWEEHADAWEHDDDSGQVSVLAYVTLDPAEWGWEGSAAAMEAVIDDSIAGTDWGGFGFGVETADGKLRVPVQGTFERSEFEPRIVADQMNRLLTGIDPSPVLTRVKDHGIIISDESLTAARDIPGRPIAYAADAGRIPNDAEIVAMCRDFGISTTLHSGYLDRKATILTVTPDESEAAGRAALNSWFRTRKPAQP